VIVDLLGKQVEVTEHAVVKNIQTIGSSLKAGMYVVQQRSSSKAQSFKVLKKDERSSMICHKKEAEISPCLFFYDRRSFKVYI